MSKIPQAPKSSTRFWALVIGIPATLILVVIFMFLYQGSTREIVSVANQFQPGAGWKLESERVEPPRIVCLNSVPCPSVFRAWSIETDVSKEDIESVLMKSNFQLMLNGDCMIPKNVSGTGVSVCKAQGVVNGYRVQLTVTKSQSFQNNTHISLNLDK